MRAPSTTPPADLVLEPELEALRSSLPNPPTREWCTSVLRYLQGSLDGDWLDRSRWPADLRAALERWERSELEAKAADPTRRPQETP